jgi:hypothetical protein
MAPGLDQRQQQQLQVAMAEQAPTATPAAALHIAPIAERVVLRPKPAVPTAPAMEAVTLVVAEPTGFTPVSATAVMMAVHESMEQEMPVHEVTPIYRIGGQNDISKLYRKQAAPG